MEETTLEYENKPIEEYQEMIDDVFQTPLKEEEKEDEKPQLVIGILLIICMMSGILAVLIKPFAVFLFAALSYVSLLGFFSDEMEKLHEKLERKLRERFLKNRHTR